MILDHSRIQDALGLVLSFSAHVMLVCLVLYCRRGHDQQQLLPSDSRIGLAWHFEAFLTMEDWISQLEEPQPLTHSSCREYYRIVHGIIAGCVHKRRLRF